MSHIHVKAEQTVDAQTQTVYETLTDYRGKRPLMLTPNFLDYTVGKGGKGAGTEIHYRLFASGRERPYSMQIEEPLKGLAITESDRNSSLVTTWTLTPIDGRRTKVRVDSEWDGSTGVGGFFERVFAPLGLRGIYSGMLSRLAALVQSPQTALEQQSTASKSRRPLFIGGAIAITAGIVTILILRNQHNN